MFSPSSPTLQRLCHLDRSSPGFQDQLYEILYSQEYIQCEENLGHDSLVWLVDYLDMVGRYIALLRSRSSHNRLLIASILLVQLPGNVYVNSGAYVAVG